MLFHHGRVESLSGTTGSNGADVGIRTRDSDPGVADPNAGSSLMVAQASRTLTQSNKMLAKEEESIHAYSWSPSCGARRMVETAALLVDDVLPHKPIRQLSPWMVCIRATQEQLPRVLSFPYPLRFLLANNPQVMGKVLGIVNQAISMHLIKKAGFKRSTAKTGAVTLIQRFGSALNLNLHFHTIFIDGVYQQKNNGKLRFHRVNAPTASELNTLVATISQRVARHLKRQGFSEIMKAVI